MKYIRASYGIRLHVTIFRIENYRYIYLRIKIPYFDIHLVILRYVDQPTFSVTPLYDL